MIKSRIPIAGVPIGGGGLTAAFGSFNAHGRRIKEFEENLAQALRIKYAIATGSGKTAFYLILKSLIRLSLKKEVILPAYTDAGLVLVIKRAGLRPVICDISPETFTLDGSALLRVISDNTLAVLAVHMFGLACEIGAIAEAIKDRKIFLIEDCAQSLGTKIGSRMSGTIGDAGFYSFNRGKNLPTYSGGCVVTDSSELGRGIVMERETLKAPGIFSKAGALFKLSALSTAMNPLFYGLFYSCIAPFKNNAIPRGFNISRYTDLQAGLGISLLSRLPEFSIKRQENGMFLIDGLSNINGIVLPRIISDTSPAFNRLPVVFKDADLRERVRLALWREGIENSPMYPYSLHQVYELGYKKEDFPNATYLAQHILTLPVHPLVPKEALEKIIEIVRGLC